MKLNALLIGANQDGCTLLRLLYTLTSITVVAIIDGKDDAPGIQLAKQYGMKTSYDGMQDEIDVIFYTTNDYSLLNRKGMTKPLVIPTEVTKIIISLLLEKDALLLHLNEQIQQNEFIFHSIHEGMIVVDENAVVTLFNKSAEEITGYKNEEVLGKQIQTLIPNSRLPYILRTKQTEIHREVVLENGKKVISTRIPMLSREGKVRGAISVFSDITEMVMLSEEITNLKDIETLLHAIIHSSEEAISVVDENGIGILINPAYTKITGFTQEDVIGKPATADIAEGESIHMKVLQSRRPFRRVRMKVGQTKRDVIVNVAPVIVGGILKGSVGIIHDVSEIQELTNELKQARQIIRTLEAKYSFEDIVGISEEMTIAVTQAKLAANTPVTVLLRGESGTGKELFAHAIHNSSSRKYNKFIRVNCAALSESLLESELFGYEDGAFSGARRGGKRGFFEEANNGSLFLDEIGEMPVGTQAKLLRVLQEKEIVRVGGTKPIPIDVRVIAATNTNLEKAITDGVFREDLYYRLNKIPIFIPALRQRKSDIPLLASWLLQKINIDYGRSIEGITDAALAYLQQYHWPGNVRELENVLGRAVIFMKNNESLLDLQHLPSILSSKFKQVNTIDYDSQASLDQMVIRFEGNVLTQYLEKFHGNKTKTAQALGISVRSLYNKLEKYERAKKFTQ
ncbi:sigma 54-interacting transcriptional regulator [Ectobacillus polymachus]|uniref:sigma 54-interacting transcriptional regulator n=1 Tax=Ectobacillus polymachus TaxID=1508806 RepID=UPI003A8897DB